MLRSQPQTNDASLWLNLHLRTSVFYSKLKKTNKWKHLSGQGRFELFQKGCGRSVARGRGGRWRRIVAAPVVEEVVLGEDVVVVRRRRTAAAAEDDVAQLQRRHQQPRPFQAGQGVGRAGHEALAIPGRPLVEPHQPVEALAVVGVDDVASGGPFFFSSIVFLAFWNIDQAQTEAPAGV